MSTPPSPPPGDWPAGEPYPPAGPIADETVVSPAPVGPPPDEPGNRIGMGMLLAIVFLAIVAAVIAAILLTRHHHHKATSTTVVVTTTTTTPTTTTTAAVQVPVPSLIGISKADALTQLQRAGFKNTVATVPGPPPAGRVISQAPTAGTKAPTGSLVRLNVSSGTAGTTTSAPTTTTAPTTTAATTTAATTTTATTAPTTTAAAPPQPTSAQVPTVSGDMGRAITAIDETGFPVSVKYVPNTQPLGTVVSQSPKAGQTKPTTAHITITVSEGPGKNPLATVPDVSGKTVPQALAAFHAVGLRLVELKRYITDKTQIGKIVEQTPTAGDQAPKNAQVLVYWGAFKKS